MAWKVITDRPSAGASPASASADKLGSNQPAAPASSSL
jgi:hypothetical protein